MTATETKDVTVATKLASLIKATEVRRMWGSIYVLGAAREFWVVCHEDRVSIDIHTEGETLPAGLTYAQMAAHISKVANEPDVSRIGPGYRAVGNAWEAV